MEIQDYFQKIKIWAFSRSSSLKQITIPPFATEIGNYGFEGCSALLEQIIIHSYLYIYITDALKCLRLASLLKNLLA